jgi:hypothetical protein
LSSLGVVQLFFENTLFFFQTKKMVSLEKYNCLFCKDGSGLELFTSQKDIQFIKCKSGRCGFFTKANEFGNYLTIIEEKVNQTYKGKAPLCCHGQPATMYISHSEKNAEERSKSSFREIHFL